MGKKLIIINRMYAGKYLTVGENIGHEIINLIRCDNGDNYLWLNADGNCDIAKFVDKKGDCLYDEIVMLMVRMHGKRQWKVLAKAEIDTSSLQEYMVPKFSKVCHDTQVKKIEEEHLYYGGQPLHQIFENNIYHDQPQNEIDIYFTFKAKSIYLPVGTPANIERTVIDIHGLKGLANQSLRMYLTKDKDIDTYRKFEQILEGEEFDWETENTTQPVDTTASVAAKEEHFLRILNEEYREPAFSNLLAYFLKNKTVMEGFAKNVLQIPCFDTDAYTIAREEKNMDLFISSPKYHIILENKIRSGLIHETKSMEKKIAEYFDVDGKKELPEQAQELLLAFQEADKYFQTDRYYAYACGKVYQQKSSAQIHGYVLFPNYEMHRVREQLRKALFGEHFTPITYKQVYTYFSTLTDAPCLTEREKQYLHEFLKAMSIHTKDIDNSFEEEMKQRFYAKIQEAAEW